MTLKNKPQNQHTIGPCELLEEENILSFRSRETRLEPKVTQVLVALSQRPHQVVTRELLIDKVWAGRSVTDDALNRCISRLRKAFQKDLDAPVRIETVAKSGYRLAFDRKRYRFITKTRAAVIIAVLTLALAVIALTRPESSSDHYKREILVVTEQWERYPEFNRDGSLITYSQGNRRDGMAVFIEQFNGAGVQQLTAGNHYDHQPTFSPDGKTLAFARLHDHGCDIRSVPSIGGDERLLGTCAARGVKDLVFTPDGKHVLMISSEAPLAPGKLSSLHLASGKTEELTPPDARGVDDLALSKNGKIAVAADFDLGVEDIFISHLNTPGKWQRVTWQQIKVHGISWSANEQDILYTSNRGGPFELWQLNVQGQNSRRIADALSGGDALSVHRDGHILLERWQQESQVILATAIAGEQRVLVEAKGVNWDAQFDANGDKLLYVSDRSGSAELWLRSDARDKRLTEYNGPWLMSPRWSPDGQQIAFAVPLGKTFQTEVYDLAQNRVLPSLTETQSFAPYWSPDGDAIYFGSKRSGTWQIYAKDLQSGKKKKITRHGGKVAQPSLDGKFLYISKADVSGIWRISLETIASEEKIIDDLAPVDWNNWRLVNNAIFYVRRESGHSPSLLKRDIITGETTLVNVLDNFLYFSGINIDKDGRYTYAKITREDADIDLLTRNSLP